MQLKLLLLIFIFFISTISAVEDSPICTVDEGPLPPFPTPITYEPIVEELIANVKIRDWEYLFEMAVKDAHDSGVSEMANINNLEDYYNFLNYLVKWVPTETETGTYIYRMLVTMYFVLNQNSIILLQSPITPWRDSPYTYLSDWITGFANKMGEFLNTKESINELSLETFSTAQHYNLDAYIKEDWESFNHFFVRRFLDGTRPIDGPENPAVIVSAADSSFDGCWEINDDSVVVLKGLPWSIKQLLHDSTYGDKFAGGKFMHAFLGPYDYHRQHAPVAGTVLEAKVIPGLTYLEVVATKPPGSESPLLVPLRRVESDFKVSINATNSPGYQFSQARGLIVIKSDIGLVAVLPIGMAQVSSVVLCVNPGDKVEKGDELSYFQFGGSDYVLVFEKDSKVDVLAAPGRHYRVGEQIAIAHSTATSHDIPTPTQNPLGIYCTPRPIP
ncbi:phosphatidylserine decarboxylase-related protein [Gigaspora margarita]|uniref:Phosphatidylserine decarboxylase-related protein n=1 Tax=Gigaspora margarita TaxID=4874 RepID=A0A8H4A9N3_GIGMA|nr:phosphatidylserine decarboxylase-related protein [Gigaspora margarita]